MSIALPISATSMATELRALPQLRRGQILGVWAAAALPMAALAWIVAPLLADRLTRPGALSRALIITMTAGLVWQFVLVAGLVRREQGTLRWSVVREALWLRAPQSPTPAGRGGRLCLVVPALIVALGIEELLPALPA